MKKKLIILTFSVLILLSIYKVFAISCPFPTEYRHVLRKALIDFFTNPSDATLTVDEVKDLLTFYLTEDLSTADCAGIDPILRKANTTIDENIVPKCSDNTEYGECSVNKPKYCVNNNLISNCTLCGCSTGYDCNNDGSCTTHVTTTTTSSTTSTTIPSGNCDSQCKAQGFTSGSCRTSCQSGESSIGQDVCSSGTCCCGVSSSLKIGIYTSSWNFNELDAQTIANTFDMSQSWWVTSPENQYGTKMNQVHALNPKYKALVYRDVNAIYDYWTDEWNLANNSGWLVKDNNGNYIRSSQWPECYIVDVTNRDYQKWVANKIKSWLDQFPFFDGVMADNGLKYSAREWGGGNAINPRTGTYFTDEEIFTGYAQLLNEIIATVGPSKLVLPNGIWNGEGFFDTIGYRTILSQVPQLNAVGSEGIFFQSYSGWWYEETKWLKSVDMVVWMQDNFLKDHPERRFDGWVPVDTLDSNGNEFLPPGATREQLMIWGFSSMLLGVKYSGQNTIGFGEGIYNYPNLMALVQKLRNIDIGYPTNDYYVISGTHVYARDFSKAKVLVNPTDSSYTVSLGQNYKTLDGNIVSSITMNVHTGEILLKIIQTCSDGTQYGYCSSTKPKYCDNGNLIDKCSSCGCPTGYECQSDGTCKSGPTQFSIKKHIVAYGFSSGFDNYYADYIANFDLFDAHVYTDSYVVGMDKIRANNPDIIILIYWDIMCAGPPPKAENPDWNEINLHEDWFLHDKYGNRLMNKIFSCYAMDVGNSGWRAHYASVVKERIDKYNLDGVFADDAWDSFRYDQDGLPLWNKSSVIPIPPGDIPTEIGQRWHNDMLGMINYVKSVIGNKLLIINTENTKNDYVDASDGKMQEAFMHGSWHSSSYFWSESEWKTSLDELIRFSTKGKYFMAHCGTELDGTETDYHKIALYCLTSYLLGYHGGKATFGWMNIWDSSKGYYPEFDEAKQLGSPINEYYSYQNVYARDFTNGKVLVNPTDASYMVSLGGNYKKLDGTTVSSITMNAHTGEILFKTTPVTELGIWGADTSILATYPDAKVFFTDESFVRPSGRTLTSYYSGWSDFMPWHPGLSIYSANLTTIENQYKSLSKTNYDGINFLSEEVYRTDIAFENGMNKQWFGEQLVGHDIYGGTTDEWQYEMFFRMLRGFANYWHSQGKKVGITCGDFWNTARAWGSPELYFGTAGWNYILNNYDYIIVYSYTTHLNDFNTNTKPYWVHIDALPARLKRIGILTRPWEWSMKSPWVWERGARALEMKNWFDRGYSIVTYSNGCCGYSLSEAWADMVKSVDLYKANKPYYEQYVSGTNLLTGYVGNTYGWVQ